MGSDSNYWTLINALVHADHRGQGGVVIVRYPDRIELSNPGSLMVSRVQLLQGGGDRSGGMGIPAHRDQSFRFIVEGSVTNSRMQEITGEHSKDITGVLQNLVRDGLLMQQNLRRWASYRVAGTVCNCCLGMHCPKPMPSWRLWHTSNLSGYQWQTFSKSSSREAT